MHYTIAVYKELRRSNKEKECLILTTDHKAKSLHRVSPGRV